MSIWVLSLIPAAIWLEPKLTTLTAQDLISVLLYLWSVAIYSLLLRDLTEGQKRAVQIEEQLDKEKRQTSQLLRDLREEQEKVGQLEEQKETETGQTGQDRTGQDRTGQRQETG